MSTGEYEKQKRESTKQGLISAYEAYLRSEAGSLDKLLALVQKFAYKKLYHFEIENKELGTINTVDDYAQDVATAVWNGLRLQSFSGDSSSFYPWVHKITHNKGILFIKELEKQRNTKVGLTVVRENDDGEKEEIDNPEIYEEHDFDIRVNIPRSIQGVDLTICKLMLTTVQDQRKDGSFYRRGRNYAEVADVLEMTEGAVKARLKRLRKGLKKEKPAKAKAEAEYEKANSLTRVRGIKTQAAD
jgi:RNA polymerase sigma factor (sigma-70 family)